MVTGTTRRCRAAPAGRRAVAGGARGRLPVMPVVADDRRGSAGCPAWIAVYRAGLALATGDPDGHRDLRPARARAPRRGRRHRACGGDGADRPRVLGERGPRGRARRRTRRPGQDAPRGTRRRRPRLSRSRWPTSRSPRAGCGEAMHTYEQALQLSGRPGRAGAARDGRHVRRDEHRPPRAQRPGRRHAAPDAQPGAGRAHRAAAEPAIAGGSRWPGSGRPREISASAVDLLDEAERVYVGDFSPDVRPVPAMRARVWVRQGRARRRPALGPRPRTQRR